MWFSTVGYELFGDCIADGWISYIYSNIHDSRKISYEVARKIMLWLRCYYVLQHWEGWEPLLHRIEFGLNDIITKALHLYYFNILTWKICLWGQQGGLSGQSACCQACQPEFMMEGENQLPQVGLWSPYTCPTNKWGNVIKVSQFFSQTVYVCYGAVLVLWLS